MMEHQNRYEELALFLNKYGYDLNGKTYTEEPKYQDTMANEIARIIEYINSAKIL